MRHQAGHHPVQVRRRQACELAWAHFLRTGEPAANATRRASRLERRDAPQPCHHPSPPPSVAVEEAADVRVEEVPVVDDHARQLGEVSCTVVEVGGRLRRGARA
eukprot:6348821-Prymnesium_polylepis.1